MKFRTHLSYNTVDTTVQRRGNRIIVQTGMFERCLAVARLMRDRNLRGISDIRDALSEHYKYADLYAAASKLRAVGILRHNGYGRWQMVLRGEQVWNNLFPRNRLRPMRAAARQQAGQQRAVG